MNPDPRRNTPALLIAASALLVFSACSSKRRDDGRPAASGDVLSGLRLSSEQRGKVTVEEVKASTFRRTLETTGTVTFDQNASTQVIAGISGPVSRILVPLGENVVAGQPLAEVTSPDFASALSGYRKAVATAGNLRRIADLDQKLFDAGGIPRRDLQQAETDALTAEADRDAALAQLHSFGIPDVAIRTLQQGKAVTDAKAVIRAPIAGTVVEKLISPGQLVAAGTTPCFTVANLSTVWVLANVFEKDLPFVDRGDPADISTGLGGTLPGRVDYISALVDPSTRAISVRIVAQNPRGALRKDLYVRADIHSSRDVRGILVPASSILRNDENLPFVFVEQSDGSFGRRPIEIANRVGNAYQIASGLREGERIIVEGGLFLQFAESQ
jgi:cobalt-zinc-cadmium efflux system membrane fusion protein